MLRVMLIAILGLIMNLAIAQEANIHGVIYNVDKQPVAFATIHIQSLNVSTMSDENGAYHLHQIPYGTYHLAVDALGFKTLGREVIVSERTSDVQYDFILVDKKMLLNEVVVTGTKTFKRKTDSPVIVSVLNSQALEGVQACNLSEGLKFQPGLRVETDCQTCNYTQLRMNGLAGGYSQILVNGRPIFSPLTGLYGLEQLPANMIERIEVVRGGGSSLYGSSAIGGTVNVITKIPKKNAYEIDYTWQNIKGQTNDHQLTGNMTWVSKTENTGLSLFVNQRDRGFYDANNDQFSEIPSIKNTSFGTNYFVLPKENQKLELSLSYLNEYRFGGEIKPHLPAHLTQQSEERTHRVWLGSADYQVNFNQENSSLVSYLAWQHTDRKHYTGIMPDGGDALQQHLEKPPYGTSDVATYNMGLQINHRLNDFLNGKNVLTLGSEYIHDKVNDEIPAYKYLIDQKTKNWAAFFQSDWEITPRLTLLSGLRLDRHNLIDGLLLSPRASLLYKLQQNLQLRFNYGAGFRAPQAFDADLHMAFAGGGVSRISLSPNLKPEKSASFNTSINYDLPKDEYIVGFTLEGFYTRLKDAFYLQPIGEDEHGELFEKQNGQGATVKGLTLELRANYDQKAQIETGFTLQSSRFDNAVQYIDELTGIKEFIRTPNDYGFAMLTLNLHPRITANVNYIYTGKMNVPHFGGAENQTKDEMLVSPSFSDCSIKLAYTFPLKNLGTNIEFYTGVKNVFDAYQKHFDIGKNRDSNFVYGPAQPRTFYLGIKLKG